MARLTRRRLLARGAVAGLGLGGLAQIACGEQPRSEPPATEPPRPAPAPRPPRRAKGGDFRSSFEDGTFEEWSLWERDDAGTMRVARADAEGIPRRDGAYVARFGVDAEQAEREAVHSKLYRSWAVAAPGGERVDDAERLFAPLPDGGPDGVYSAWFLLPPDYRADDDWVNVFQWKEGYLLDSDDPDSMGQDPQWWLNLTPAGAWERARRPAGLRPTDPVLIVNNWDGEPESPQLLAAPRGRWFQVAARLRSGEHIDWFVDGRFWQRSSAAEYPIGLSKQTPTEWVFGVGHYGGRGHLWVDDVRYTVTG